MTKEIEEVYEIKKLKESGHATRLLVIQTDDEMRYVFKLIIGLSQFEKKNPVFSHRYVPEDKEHKSQNWELPDCIKKYLTKNYGQTSYSKGIINPGSIKNQRQFNNDQQTA
jgi:hypothetical protein